MPGLLDAMMKQPDRQRKHSLSTVGTDYSNAGGATKKSNLKVKTLRESLRKPYRTESSSSNTSRSIAWNTIEIREYARTVGDNPSCSCGPPLAIDWDFRDAVVVPVEEFEEYRPPRRSQYHLLLGLEQRTCLLMDEWQVPEKEIAQAIRTIIKAKNQRRRTLNNIGRISNMEEKWENMGRTFMKRLRRRKDRQQEAFMEDTIRVSNLTSVCVDRRRRSSVQSIDSELHLVKEEEEEEEEERIGEA